MSRALTGVHFVVLVGILPLWLLGFVERQWLMILCGIDLFVFIGFVAVHLQRGSLNLLAPSLWATAGYLLFGQFPMFVNLAFDLAQSGGYPAAVLPETVGLLLVGYRVMTAAIFACLPRSDPREMPSREMPPLTPVVPLCLVLVGAFARLFIGNNVTGVIVEWAWYYAFLFTCTPVGLAMLFGVGGQRRVTSLALSEKIVVCFVCLVAAATALVDKSRKDTGMILIGLIAFGIFRVVPQRPFLDWRTTRAVKFGAVMILVAFILMATRAFSWTIANNTDLGEELLTSFMERRANDVTEILAFVVETTPDVYPYLNGITLGSILPIPRMVWAGRPAAHSYYVGLQIRGIPIQEFDPEYMGDNQLSVSAHMLGEGYGNRGWIGAMALEALFGCLVGLYECALRRGKLIVLRLLYPMLLFFILTQQRGDVAMMNGAWMMAAGLLWIVLKCYRTPVSRYVIPQARFNRVL